MPHHLKPKRIPRYLYRTPNPANDWIIKDAQLDNAVIKLVSDRPRSRQEISKELGIAYNNLAPRLARLIEAGVLGQTSERRGLIFLAPLEVAKSKIDGHLEEKNL